ncbi:hypothetical protein GC087_07115 [Pantoea sp. JZ2]|nr:hypothetical protein GC087_07115 [Pantoea sp. JZ2]
MQLTITKTVILDSIMKYRYQNGMFIFTACVLGIEQQFSSFKAGVEWVFTQKMAASVAADME